MRIGEVCLYTQEVMELARFYRRLLGLEADSGEENPIHQFILSEETSLTIYNDGIQRQGNQSHICLAFTVQDVDREYERLQALRIQVLSPPTLQPWGAKNMMLLDPEGNQVVLRSFAQE